MIDIAKDIQADIKRSLSEKRLQTAEVKVLEKMDEIKNRESLRGNSPAQGGRWDNRYNRQYARREKGGRRSPVTLRNGRNRIGDTSTKSGSKGSTLSFRSREMGQIFFYHDEGINYSRKGFTQRQIYPDADNQVPEEVDATAINEIFKLWQTG